MAVATVEAFLEALEKSGLLDEAQLAEARQRASETADAKGLAKLLVQKGVLSRWQAAQLLAGRTTVFFLGKYKLIEMLGRGGMGGVFLAHHTMMNRRVALKVVSKQISQDQAALEQFLAEARAIAALDHPNIVRAYNVDCEEGRYYLVMEYVEGKNLQQLVEEEGPLDFQLVADYIRQAADGLAHAHQHNLIHCDIKPSNLLVTPEGVVKILDLGLARLAASTEEQKQADPRLVGTVDYQAPETALGEKVDARADIYSLGCTMFFLLTGKPPFGEGTLHERIVKHQTQPPPDIASLRPGVPKDLAAICRKMMAKKPADRFQSAEDLSKLLARWRPPQPKLRKAVPLEETDSPSKTKPGPKAPSPKDTPDSEIATAAGKSEDTKVASPLAEITPKKQAPPPLPTWVWIAGGATAVVLVGLVLVWLLIQGSSESSGQAKGKAKMAAGPKVEDEPSEFKPPQPPTPPETGKQEKPSPETGAQEKPSTPPEEKTPKKEPSEKGPTEKPAPKPKETPPPKPEEKSPAKPKPKPTEPEKPPTPEPKEQPKKEEPKPPPPPPTPQSPFAAFLDPKGNPKPIDLPEFPKEASAVAPKALGKLAFDAEARWYPQLIGGNLVFKGGQLGFRMVDQKPTDAGQRWDVFLDRGPREKGPSEPARIGYFEYKKDSKELLFSWQAGADPAQANLLRNCVLDITYGRETVPLYLRTPIEFPPLQLHPLKPASKPIYQEIPYLPGDPERVLLDFSQQVKLEPPEEWKNHKEQKKLERIRHKVVFDPPKASPINPKKPILVNLMWTDRANNDHAGVVLEIRPQLSGSRLRLDARLKTPPLQEFRKKPPIEQAIAFLDTADRAAGRLQQDSREDPKKRMPDKERDAVRQAMNTADYQAWLVKMHYLLDEGIVLHYRVLYDLNKYQVPLGKSSASASAEKPPSGKN